MRMMIFLVSLVLAGLPPLPDMPTFGRPSAWDPPDAVVRPPSNKKDFKISIEEAAVCKDSYEKALSDLEDKTLEAIKEVKEDCPSSEPVKRSTEIFKRNAEIIKNKRNNCIALVGSDVVSNPYHEKLLGRDPNKVVTRMGSGKLILLDGKISTTNSAGATWKISRSISFTKSRMVGVTYSDGTTNTMVNGSSWTNSQSNSIQSSITESLEKSNTSAILNEKNGNYAKDIQKSITKAFDLQVSNSTNWNKEDASTDTETWNTSNGSTNSTDNGKDTAKTTGTISTNGWDRQTENSKSNDIAINKVFTCTFTKSSGDSASAISESSGEMSGGINGGFELRPFGNGFNIGANIGGSQSLRKTVEGSMTSETSGSITYTFSLTKTKTELMAKRCGTNGNVQEHDTTTESTHNSDQKSVTYNKDEGGSKALTKSKSEGASNEVRTSDSISKAYTGGFTDSNGWSLGKTDTYGNTLSKGITNSSDLGFTNSNTGDFSLSVTVSKTNETSIQETDSTTWETSRELSFSIGPDDCVVPACSQAIESTIIPYACAIPNKKNKFGKPLVQIVPVEIQKRLPRSGVELTMNNELNCDYSLIKCEEVSKINLQKEEVYRPPLEYKFIRSQSIYTDGPLPLGISKETTQEKYYFGWGKEGEFGVYTQSGVTISSDDRPVWRCGVKIKSGYVKISDNGVIEVRSNGELFQDFSGDVVVWSSVPAHLNETVGIIGNREKSINFGYKLIIEPNGIANLYDSAYVKIWTSSKNIEDGSRHAYGYRFPTHVPYVFRDSLEQYPICNEESDNLDDYEHIDLNYMPNDDVNFLGDSIKYGTPLNQNEGIKSENGKVTFYISPSPNLLIKEGCRILWESYVSNPWQGEAPYSLIISTPGQIVLKDFKKRVIWTTKQLGGIIRKVIVTNSGILKGLDEEDRTLWQSREDKDDEDYGKREISGIHYALSVPIIDYDDLSERPVLTLSSFPLINMYNGKCISVNLTDASIYTDKVKIDRETGIIDYSMCQLFNLNPVMYTYTISNTFSKCIGHGVVERCNANTLWRHYTDGLLVNVNTGGCLDANAQPINCLAHNYRMDKLWTRGANTISMMTTRENRQMFPGTFLYENKMGFRYFVNSKSELTFESWDYTNEKYVKHYVWVTGAKGNDYTTIKLLDNGFVANTTTVKQKSGHPTYKGVLPYRTRLSPAALNIIDAKNNVIWSWSFRS